MPSWLKVFSRANKYAAAAANAKIDEHADPKIQIQQAIEAAQTQHARLAQQAAAVIGNKNKLEMNLTRQLALVSQYQSSARQAVQLADQARAQGDEAKAQQFEQSGEAFATQLVTAEQTMEDLKTMHAQADQAAAQAKQAIDRNAAVLQEQLAERQHLLSQLEQAKMQEQVSASLTAMSELAAPGDTPTLDNVRDKIEARYANALGSAELAQNSVQGRMMEVQQSARALAGQSRLAEIRASLAGPSTAGALTAGSPVSAQPGTPVPAENVVPFPGQHGAS